MRSPLAHCASHIERLQGEIERREILGHRTNEYRWRLNNLEALWPYMQPSEATPDTQGEH